MAPIFSATILGRHRGEYFQCPACRLIQVANPHWLSEAYSSVIAATDVGLVSRNLANQKLLEPILSRLAAAEAKILDVGGGYGLLCRSLRDRGFACFTSDIYCENLFAKAFEPAAGFQAEVLLAFEVMEHIGDPLEFVAGKLAEFGAETLIFTTLTYSDDDFPDLGWWYYAFETGQHITFYHRESLQMLASKLGMEHFSLSPAMHLLTKRPLSRVDRLLLSRERPLIGALYGAWVRLRRRGKSLTWSDYVAAKGRVRAASAKAAENQP
jgi:hypothetical protein